MLRPSCCRALIACAAAVPFYPLALADVCLIVSDAHSVASYKLEIEGELSGEHKAFVTVQRYTSPMMRGGIRVPRRTNLGPHDRELDDGLRTHRNRVYVAHARDWSIQVLSQNGYLGDLDKEPLIRHTFKDVDGNWTTHLAGDVAPCSD